MLATTAWTAVVISRNRTPGQPLLQAAPPGYRGTAVGVVLFGVAGGLDLLWHELLGIEVSLDALVSPTHLLLGFSLFLILGTAVRSARAAGHSAAGRSANLTSTPAAMFAVVLMTGLGASSSSTRPSSSGRGRRPCSPRCRWVRPAASRPRCR